MVSDCVQSRRDSFIHSTLVSTYTASCPSLGTGATEKKEVPALKDLTGSWGREMNKKGEKHDNEN